MKAIHLIKYGASNKAFETREVDIPIPENDEVIIKAHCSGLNFADVVARRGLYPDAPKNPAIIGYDVAGTIHALGSEVKGFKIGDRVTALTRFGGYAQFAATKAQAASKIPESLDFISSTALTTQGCTAYYCAEDSVTLHPGDKVLIHAAAGGVGSMLVQLAKNRGCEIFGTASTPKLGYLKEIGVNHPIDYRKLNFKSEVEKIAGKKPLDYVFDSIGGSVFKKSYKLLGPGGKLVFFGAADQLGENGSNIFKTIGLASGFGVFSPLQLIMESRSLIGVNMLRIADNKPNVFNHCLKSMIKRYEEGNIKPKIGKVYKADQIVEAHDYLEGRKSIGKVVIEW